jgi:CRP-like cAMP-binding protein
MPRPATSRSVKAIDKGTRTSRHGHPVHNKILNALSDDERAALSSKLEFVSLPVSTVMNEVGVPIEFVFFPNDGLASFLNIMADGKSVEVGLCGKEGFVGIPVTAGLQTSPARVIMQVAGSAFRLSARDFAAVLRQCPKLTSALQRFAQEMALQSAQVAACNRLHEVDERLARWLLMSQDRLGGDLVPLTQEFLAHMLGTRRASVTVAAGILQKAGLIKYTRGALKIENRRNLEAAACECYGIITRQVEKWQSESR